MMISCADMEIIVSDNNLLRVIAVIDCGLPDGEILLMVRCGDTLDVRIVECGRRDILENGESLFSIIVDDIKVIFTNIISANDYVKARAIVHGSLVMNKDKTGDLP